MWGTLAELANARLLEHVHELVRRVNQDEAELLAYLGEVDARRLYLEKGCPSMFVWCQRVLHFAEGVAYKRIQAARTARRHPELLDAVRRGDLHLTAVALLAPKLDASNCAELIRAARHRTAEEIKRLLADREPKPTAPAFVRQLREAPKVSLPPVLPPAAPLPAPPPPARAKTQPLGAERYRVQFTADRETHAQLKELQGLMRHQIPDGDVGKILSKAIAVLLAKVRKQKFGETSKPRAQRVAENPSRHIPAAARREIWERDAARCTYVSAGGRRCDAKEFLEFDHVEAWSRTRSHSVGDMTLRCRAHNQLRARLDFGEEHMARFGRQLDLNPVRRLDEPALPVPQPLNREAIPGGTQCLPGST